MKNLKYFILIAACVINVQMSAADLLGNERSSWQRFSDTAKDYWNRASLATSPLFESAKTKYTNKIAPRLRWLKRRAGEVSQKATAGARGAFTGTEEATIGALLLGTSYEETTEEIKELADLLNKVIRENNKKALQEAGYFLWLNPLLADNLVDFLQKKEETSQARWSQTLIDIANVPYTFVNLTYWHSMLGEKQPMDPDLIAYDQIGALKQALEEIVTNRKAFKERYDETINTAQNTAREKWNKVKEFLGYGNQR